MQPLGRIVDMGIKDANNMGAAMAPSAVDTIVSHLQDTGRKPSYYDLIVTGDLGHIGKDIVCDMLQTYGYNVRPNYNDCGVLIFDKEAQDTHSGGSGCACCGTVFSGFLFNQLKQKKYNKVLLVATGALMNSTSSQQGESIPRNSTCSFD
jgi:stage V sporulation protein AD